MARKAGGAGRGGKPDGEPRRLKKTFVLAEETARKLASFAGRYGLWESKVVEDALGSYLVGFRSFGGPSGEPGPPEIRLAGPAGGEAEGPARESA